MYGHFVDHLPSALLLVALAFVLFACSRRPTVGSSSSRDNRQQGRWPAKRGGLDRAVEQADDARGATAEALLAQIYEMEASGGLTPLGAADMRSRYGLPQPWEAR